MSYYALLFIDKPTRVPSGADTNAAWNTWIVEQKKKNIYHSGTAFTMEGKRLFEDIASDLPISNNTVGGYVVIKADDLDLACAIAKTSPHARWGGMTEIRYCRDF